MNIATIRQEIIQAFHSHWEHNDKAHRVEHFEEVYQTAMEIQRRLGLTYDPKLILFAAYFHDLFAWSRKNHHDLSSEFIYDTDHPLIEQYLNREERSFVAVACLEHRASYEGKFTLEFSELINSADRGLPGDVQAMLERAMAYRSHRHPEEPVEVCKAASVRHLKDKFGKNGYARYPDLYKAAFGKELAAQQEVISRL